MSDLMQALFAKDELVRKSLESSVVLPNIMNGIDIRERNGDVIASVIPGVSGDTVVDNSGETIAYIRKNATGNTTIDLGMGHTINTTQGIDGYTLKDNLEGVIGFIKPNIGDGFDVYSATHERLLSVSPDVMNGWSVTVPISPDIPDILSHSNSVTENLDILNTVNSVLDVNDGIDMLDSLDVLHMISDWL